MFKRIAHKVSVLLRWLSIRINRIMRFVTHDIWYLDTADFASWKARLVRDAKTVILMMRTFADQKIGFQVSALSYRSMLSVVPFVAIAFYLTGGLGLSDKFTEILMSNISDQNLIISILTAADNIVTTAESGLFGFVSMLSFVWIVIALMISVRRVFNNVWKVKKERNFLKMIGFVIAILVLAPFVIILFFSGSVVYSHVLDFLLPGEYSFSEGLKSFLSWVLFAVAAVLILSAMYKYIPGTHVQYRHAFKAALIAGVVFSAIQYLYLETQVLVAKQSAVYGVLAAIPLFMIWLNMGWSIILYGAELSFAFQNIDNENVVAL